MRVVHGGLGGSLPRRRLTAAVMATALALTVPFMDDPAAQAAERPAAGVVPPLAVNKDGALLGEGFKGESNALSRLNRKKGQPRTAPRSNDAARSAAKNTAVQLEQRSYWDADQAATGANAAAQTNQLSSLGPEPPEPGATECLSRPDSNRPEGVTLNRGLWCQRYRLGNSLYKVEPPFNLPVYVGKITMEFTAVVAGRRDDRSARVYFKAVPGSVDYDVSGADREIAPTMAITIGADCEDTGCSRIGQPIYNKWADWDTDDHWWSWDITSDETASTQSDKVLFHNWYLTLHGSGGDFVFDPDGNRTPERTIRCDSADYFQQFGNEFPKACINSEVIPHLQYNTDSENHGAVARHIKTAQNYPDSTYPIEFEPKQIPGKFTGNVDDPGLHRVDGSGPIARANERIKDAACGRTSPYNDQTGLPPYDTTQLHCDEYPFQSTDEGAFNPNWDFSEGIWFDDVRLCPDFGRR